MNAATILDDTPLDTDWWYRAAGGTSGPVSAAELRRLSSGGPLDGDTLVWREGFGAQWRRLAEALAPAARPGPPAADHGRWTKAFAAVEANPRRLRWSWLGLLGPLTFLRFGMWRKALVILAAAWLVYAAIGVAQWERGSHPVGLPGYLMMLFCALRLKTDLYRHRVLGERMWPALRFMAPAWVCGPIAAVAFLALVVVQVVNPVDGLLSDVAGVWGADGVEVVLDVAGSVKRIAYDGRTYAVEVARIADEGLVFDVLRGGPARITVRKRWAADRATWSLDLYEGDQLLANLLYLRPA